MDARSPVIEQTEDIPKFLCDEMLQRLGSWLRAAGYDTLIASDGEDDYSLLRKAIDEDRYLITCDKELSRHRRAEGTVVFLEASGLEPCIAELTKQLHINWLKAPLTRCMGCNTVLIDASPQQIRGLQLKNTSHIDAAFYCSQCKQVFWDGSHVKRLRENLNKWQEKYSSN